MGCWSPLRAYRANVLTANGKRAITFNPREALSERLSFLELPCGQCGGCRLERSRQWAVRIMHEKQMHSDSCFLTLTYDDKFLPPDMSLSKRELTLFHKRLHNKLTYERGFGIKYYSCGEYGDRTNRPHYHCIIFGYDFSDKKFFSRNSRGESLYVSDELSKLWPYGHNTVGAVEFDSAAYVARYCMKKVNGDKAADHYMGRQPEFPLMSKGLGAKWYEKFGAHTHAVDTVVLNSQKMRPPRYYDKRLELLDPSAFEKVRLRRVRKAVKSGLSFDGSYNKFHAKEVMLASKSSLKKGEF